MHAALICREYPPSPICPWPCRWRRPVRSTRMRTMAVHMMRTRMMIRRKHGGDGTSAAQCAAAMRRARVAQSKASRNRARVRASAVRRAAEPQRRHSVTCRKILTRRMMMKTKMKRTRRTRRVAQKQLAPARLRIRSHRRRERAAAAGSGAILNRQTAGSCVRNLQWRKKVDRAKINTQKNSKKKKNPSCKKQNKSYRVGLK